MMYAFGQITYILLDFEPIVLDEAGFQSKNMADDGEIYLQDRPVKNMSLEGARNITKKWLRGGFGDYEGDQTGNSSDDDDIYLSDSIYVDTSRPIVKQSLNDLQASDIDTWFGILNFAPGLQYMVQLGSSITFVRGFIRGSQVTSDHYVERCDNLVVKNLVNETERLQNLTLTIFEQSDPFEAVFYVFDVALLGTKIIS